ncbi:MAG: hypothetical protein HUU21_06110 [Polyangiaceae bacterium]|nr:hypothetical protein [Polyangiaceae bacterium]NUQ73110.1 hypothetical protein [Polyangiaceae bacterium]
MAKKPAARAAQANARAKARVSEETCVECGQKKKCDAKLPEDETTRKVALTTFAEAGGTSSQAEFTAVASVMHNRVGKAGFGNAQTVDGVLSKTYYDKRAGVRKYEFHGYQNARYKKGESGDLEPGDCEALKRAIAAAEDIQKNGVPAEYKDYTFFAAANAVSDKSRGTVIGKTIFGNKQF